VEAEAGHEYEKALDDETQFACEGCGDLVTLEKVKLRSLQRPSFVPRRARIQTSRSSSVIRITGIALGWIGSTTAFGAVVRKP
jgi:hypothetical protein